MLSSVFGATVGGVPSRAQRSEALAKSGCVTSVVSFLVIGITRSHIFQTKQLLQEFDRSALLALQNPKRACKKEVHRVLLLLLRTIEDH